jgi:hypothetical protein
MVNFDNNYTVGDFNYNDIFTITSECINFNIKNAHGDYTHSSNSHLLDTCKSTNFKIFHQNIWGITHKIEEFLISLSCTNPQVLCLTEHHLRPEEIDNIPLGQYTLGACFCR